MASPFFSRFWKIVTLNQQSPNLDDLWRNFSKKVDSILGSGGGGNNSGGGESGTPQMPTSLPLVALAVVVSFWLVSGVFIVQEGQQAVVTQFGKYHTTVGAGFNWRIPYPVQRHETVFVTQIRSVDVGHDTIIGATGLRDSAMLTQDENIVEIKFAVQYRLSNARAYLFNSADPDASVLKAAETALREVVGNMKMDVAIADERDQIAPRVRTLMQTILDRYGVGIEVVGINLQQGGVRPPEQVQAAFDDVLKAGQERERAKNEAEAYANDIIPRARGTAARLLEEASGYRERIIAQASGDARRFELLQAQYAKAPRVTRERLYLETMEEVYSNVTKIMVDSRQNSNLLYLPLDKIMSSSISPLGSGDTISLGSVSSVPTIRVPDNTNARVLNRSRN